jgi:DNA (cytosine-5)-methyltransferase 1
MTSDANGVGGHGEGGLDLRTTVHWLPTPTVTSEDRWGDFGPAVARWGAIIDRLAPAPLVGKSLSAPFVEWMMGADEGWVTDVPIPKTAQLRCLGNGVVVRQVEAAFRVLCQRAEVS